jgi:hypothetical protein
MSKREISETSKNIYSKNIIRLNDGEPVKNYNFLKKNEIIMSKINHLKPNSQRTYLISIVSTIKGLKGFDKEFKYYYDKMMELNKELKVNNEKSETQQANWINQDEVLKIYHSLAEKAIPLLKLKGNKKINQKEWDDILDFVVLSLYVNAEPRRNKDYQLMKVVKKAKDLGDDYKEFNYYLPSNAKFLFYNFKTAGTYNLQEIPVNGELENILLQYLNIHPLKKEKSFFLLVNYNGEELKQVNSITRILNRIFNKKIGVSMLRNIYLTDKFKTPMEELKETANNMGTSSNTIQNNYIKMDEK